MIAFALVAQFSGCRPTTPFSPSINTSGIADTPGQLPPKGNWTGGYTVVAVTGACVGESPGDVRRDLEWLITITGQQITIDEDMANWPTDDTLYTGTFDGRQFTASYVPLKNGANICSFKGGTLSGSMNDDLTAFEALETLTWGLPGTETIEQRHLVASKR
jgi:hypothetical protein